jgi:hypothetical protein
MEGVSEDYDYYYATGADVDSLEKQGKTVIKKYEISNAVLLK